MTKPSTHLLRWLVPVGLGALLIAGATAVSAQDDEQVRILTLDDAIQYAIENSPDMIVQRISLEQSRLNLKKQEARQKASFTVRLSPYTYTRDSQLDSSSNEWYTSESTSSSASLDISQPIVVTNGTLSLSNSFNYKHSLSDLASAKERGTDESTSYRPNFTLKYTQSIFHYNEQKMEIVQLERSLQTTELNYVSRYMSMEQNITKSYYSLYESKNDLEIAKDDLAQSEDSYKLTQNKVDAGLLAQSELSQAYVTLLNAQLTYENKVQDYEDSKDTFKMDLGLPLDDDFDIELDIEPNPIDIDVDFAVATALENNISLKTTAISLLNAEDDIIVSASENSFSGDISLSYGLGGTGKATEMGDAFDDMTKSQSVGLTLDIPIWDWGVADISLRNSELSLESDKIDAEDARKQLIITVRQSCRSLEKLQRQYEISLLTFENAELTYNISYEQYSNGELSAMDLEDQRTQLTEARQSVTSYLLSYRNELLSLKSNTLYDFEKDQPVDIEAYLGEDN